MICGETAGFIGSENFSKASLHDNREMGLTLGGRDLGLLREQFARDWARAHPA